MSMDANGAPIEYMKSGRFRQFETLLRNSAAILLDNALSHRYGFAQYPLRFRPQAAGLFGGPCFFQGLECAQLSMWMP